MKEQYQISETNPMLLTYLKYLRMTYSSNKTRELYESHARKFLNEIYNKTKEEPLELTQSILDDYVIWLNSSKTTNPFYRAWIKSFRLAFDIDEKLFKLKTKLDRSKERTKIAVYDWIPKETVDVLIAKGSPYISMMVSIFFDTGRRLADIIKCDLSHNNKEWDLDLKSRTIRGISKNNMEYRGHFSKQTAGKIYSWIKRLAREGKNVETPFMICKRDGNLAVNQESAFDYRLKQEAKYLGLKDVHGKEIHTHALRHCIQDKAKILTNLGWKRNTEIEKGDFALTYNIKARRIEYAPILKIHRYRYNDILYHIKKQKYIDTLVTPEHNNIIKLCKKYDAKWKKKGKDIWDKDYSLISINKLLENKRRILFKTYNNPVNIRNIKMLLSGKVHNLPTTIGVYKAALLGWILTDGCINWRIRKSRNKQLNVTIAQSITANPHKCKIIEYLLEKSGLIYIKTIQKPTNKSKFGYKQSPPSQMIDFRICNNNPKCIPNFWKKDSNINWIFKYLTVNKRPIYRTLLLLNYDELKSMHDAMMLGDGSIRGEFTTQNKNIIDFFRIISTLIGYRTQLGYGNLTLKEGRKYRVYLTKKDCIQLLKRNINKKKYNGYVWCPETRNNTWIAKDNETIFITGNSTGRYLGMVHKWPIQDVAVKLSHLDINQTRKYISADLEQVEAKEDKEVFNVS